MALRPSSVPLHVVLPEPLASSFPHVPDLESDLACAANPTVIRLLATFVTNPHIESTAVFSLVTEQVDFAARSRLDYVASLATESESLCPPSVEGEPALSMKRPPGSPPAFKACCVARGFSQRQGVDFFQNFSPTVKMTTLRVLLHIAAECDYELHSLDFSKAFLQSSLHEEIWLGSPPGFTGSFPEGTKWSLRRPVYGLRQAPHEWHDTLRTILAALGVAPSSADPSLFLRTDTTMPPFDVLVYVDDLVFATAETEALAIVKAELQERHTCTDLAPPSDESVEPSGPYPELVGCLICEDEIYARAMAAQELRWLTYLLTDLGERPHSPPVLYVDNKAVLALCREQRLEHRTKHIALHYFVARELQQRRQLRLSYVASRANTVDVFTKALGFGDHQRFCTALGLVPTLPHLVFALLGRSVRRARAALSPPDSLHSDLKGDSRGVAMAAIASNAAVAATSACTTTARADTRQAASTPAAVAAFRHTSTWKQGGAMQQLRSKCHVAPATRRATFRVFAAEGNPAVSEDVSFSWSGPGAEVLLTGDFLNWEVKIPLVKLPNGTFSARQKLPPGRYAYKFIVDGVWQHSPDDATISDGAGGFNNTLVIEDPNKNKAEAAPEAAPAAPAAAPAAAAPAPKAAGAPAGKKVVGKAVGKAVGKKVVAKAIGLAMSEDVIPALLGGLGKEEGVRNVEINFTDNVLCGSFIKNDIPINFWAYFPDGALD
ncbi:unnamed protein product, partial [Closterium sp. NIES-54]